MSVNDAPLPVAYGQRGDTVTRIYADTLVLTPASGGGTYVEIAHIGVTTGSGPEQRARIAPDPGRRYFLQGDSLELITVGGLSRGAPAGEGFFVLWNVARAQRWRYVPISPNR